MRKYCGIYVRWLCAFRGRYSLSGSIRFEMARNTEAACEPLFLKGKRVSSSVHSNVGLLVDSNSITKQFYNDCWSEYTRDERTGEIIGKRLHATRLTNKSDHGEAWFTGHSAYIGIVMRRPVCEMSRDDLNVIRKASRKFGLPVYLLDRDGKMKEVEL